MHEGEENDEFDIHRRSQLDERIQLLQQLIDHHDENDIYFDCVEQFNDDQKLMEMLPVYQPWIVKIRLSVHRKTNFFRRIFNGFHRTKTSSLENLAREFIRIYSGRFNYPVGFRFHLSHDKEKWLLILKDITLVNDQIYPYPPARITFLHKDYTFIAR